MFGIKKNNVHSAFVGLLIEANGIHRPMFAEINDHRESLPGRPGSILYPQEPGNRVIEIDFALIHENLVDKRKRVREVAAFLYSRGEERIEFDDEPDVYYIGKISEAPTPDELYYLDRFSVTLTLHPYSIAKSETEVSGTVTPEASLSFVNDGTTDSDVAVLTFTIGSVASTFEFGINGDTAKFPDAVTAGDVFEINLGTYEATLTSGESTDPASHLLTGTIPYIHPGNNTLTISGPSSAEAMIRYRKTYL